MLSRSHPLGCIINHAIHLAQFRKGYQNHVSLTTSRTSFVAFILVQPQKEVLTHASHDALLGLGLGLLLDVVLGTALLGLAGVVLLLVLGLGRLVASNA